LSVKATDEQGKEEDGGGCCGKGLECGKRGNNTEDIVVMSGFTNAVTEALPVQYLHY
jgi:hypothetical protein